MSGHRTLAIGASRKARLKVQADLGADVIALQGRGPISRNGDVEYPFRQHSDFLYLTGCSLEGAKLLLTAKRDTLFIPKIDQNHQVWLGGAITIEEAKTQFGFDDIQWTEDFNDALKALGGNASKLHISSSLSGLATRLCPMTPRIPWKADRRLASQRVIKSSEEIDLLRLASEATGETHRKIMSYAKPGMEEWQIRDAFTRSLQEQGIREHSFPTISAAQTNGAILHYTRWNAPLIEGDLFLLDAGGEVEGYAGDVTRTWPVSSKFTPRQKELYEAVLKTQAAIEKKSKPGTWMSELQTQAIETLTESLLSIGLLKGDLKTLIEKKCISLFYPHGCSHMLGLDVHDVAPPQKRPGVDKPLTRSEQKLEEGMVITNEPGIYFIAALLNDPEKEKEFGDMVDWKLARSYLDFGGIRIEDDLHITPNGCENLTPAPKSVEAIEDLRASAISK
jgi:Xaa-Pro dipeptidase